MEACSCASHPSLSMWTPGNFVSMLFLIQKFRVATKLQPFNKFHYDVGVFGHQRRFWVEKGKKFPTGVVLVFSRLFSHLYLFIIADKL